MFLITIGLTLSADDALGAEVFASVFAFGPPGMSDPDPTLTGVIKIDLETGEASPFIDEGTGNIFVLSDVAVGPHDGLLYVSTQLGTIERFDADTGAHLGNFAFFPGAEGGDGVNTMRFAADGTLFAATGSGIVAEFSPAGARLADRATGLNFPSGIAMDSSGSLFVSTGGVGGPGEVVRLDAGAPVTVVPNGAIGGGSGVTFRSAVGDYDDNGITDGSDYAAWATDFGTSASGSDGNGDGVVDAADYTLWRDNEGDEDQLIIPDLFGDRLHAHGLISDTGGTLTTIPIPLPDPLPGGGIPSNSPSEVIVTPEGTLLVSTLGPTQRPDNNAALLEFDMEGNLLSAIQTDLPPLSGIAWVPASNGSRSIPEPASLVLLLAATAPLARRRRS